MTGSLPRSSPPLFQSHCSRVLRDDDRDEVPFKNGVDDMTCELKAAEMTCEVKAAEMMCQVKAAEVTC